MQAEAFTQPGIPFPHLVLVPEGAFAAAFSKMWAEHAEIVYAFGNLDDGIAASLAGMQEASV